MDTRVWNPPTNNIVEGEVPALYAAHNKVGQNKNILLMNVPYCTHPSSKYRDDDFQTKSTYRPFPSLALATLAGFFEKYKSFDYHLKVIDLNLEGYTTPDTPIDEKIYGKLLIETIIDNPYHILALSAPFIYSHKWVGEAVKLSRKYHPNAKIIIGGGYPTLYPERVLIDHDIDASVVGEGEDTFLHLINCYNKIVDNDFEQSFPFEGYAAKDENGKVFYVPRKRGFLDIHDLPPAGWHYLNIERYFDKSGDRIFPIEASRGCPFTCTYCNTFISWGRKSRYKSADNLVKEIEKIHYKYKNPRLHFVDDNFSLDRDWTKSVLAKLIQKNLKLSLGFSNFSSKCLNEEILDLLFKAGTDVIVIAIESGSYEIQKRLNKPFDKEKTIRLIKYIKKKNKRVHVLWMAGFPGETIDQLNDTINLARDLGAHKNQFAIVIPYPGTRLYDEAKQLDLLKVNDADLETFDNRKGNFFKSEYWSYSELRDLIYDANIELNFLKSPDLKTSEGRKYLIEIYKSMIIQLPNHIMAHIMLGYLYKNEEGNIEASQEHYNEAIRLFSNDELYECFNRYLSLNEVIINDFNLFCFKNNSVITTQRDYKEMIA